MKRGTPDHPKTHKLSRLLNIPRAHAVGLLEMLWHWTSKFAIQGDVGRWSDSEIAAGAGWEDSGTILEFVRKLQESGWIDSDPVHRYLIHDWADHADDAVRKTLKNRGLEIFRNVSGKVPNDSGKVSPALAFPEPLPEPEPEPLPEPEPEPLPEPEPANKHAQILPDRSPVRNPLPNPKASVDEEIVAWFKAEFWPVYWRKADKAGGLASAKKHCRTPEVRAAATAGVRQQTTEMMSREESHRPHAATWINHHRWEDELQLPGLIPASRYATPPSRSEAVLKRLKEDIAEEISNGQ